MQLLPETLVQISVKWPRILYIRDCSHCNHWYNQLCLRTGHSQETLVHSLHRPKRMGRPKQPAQKPIMLSSVKLWRHLLHHCQPFTRRLLNQHWAQEPYVVASGTQAYQSTILQRSHHFLKRTLLTNSGFAQKQRLDYWAVVTSFIYTWVHNLSTWHICSACASVR